MDLQKVLRIQRRKKKKKFFNLGPRNDWKKSLDKKFVDEIENSFKDEMKELGYI